jgi:hypothetical protein
LFEAVAEGGEFGGSGEMGGSGRAFARCPHIRIDVWGTRFRGTVAGLGSE